MLLCIVGMLVLNDQLKHHLDNWDDDNDIVEDGPVVETKNYENAPTNTPQSSSPLKDRLNLRDTLVILVCGFLLGFFFRNTSDCIRFGSLVAIAVGAVVVCAETRAWRSKNRQAKIHAQRLELSSLLALIGAPPVSVKKQIDDLQFTKEAIDCVTSFERLLVTVDLSLERLKSATSMKLGLGLWSPAVHRVEHRQARSLESSKKVLGQGMLHCLALLLQEEPTVVVTLSWLQSTRQRLVAALSDYISSIDNVDDLIQCRESMEELTAYVQASFIEIKTNESPSPLDPVAQHLHAAEIALWAYHQEDDDESSHREWIQRFHDLLNVAHALHETLGPGSIPDTAMEEEQEQSLLQSSLNSSPSSFEDQGIMDNSEVCAQENSMNDKTLVFSGKGSVERKRQQTSTPLAPSAAIASMTQAMLFQELQTRLSTLDKVDEVNVNKADDDEDESPPATMTTARSFALSGSLLAELQSSLGLQSPMFTVESYGD